MVGIRGFLIDAQLISRSQARNEGALTRASLRAASALSNLVGDAMLAGRQILSN
jgi:hypothetical protein